MFAIVQVGSQQFRIAEGDSIDTQLFDKKEGSSITLDKILFFSDGSAVKIGQPFLKDVKVTAKVVRHFKADKAISFKYRRRKNSLWKKGHRQQLTTLNITKIAPEK